MRSRTFSAKANSVAQMANPKKSAAQPGPGVTSITSPATITSPPTTNTSDCLMALGVRFQPRFNRSILYIIQPAACGILNLVE